ncbi:hypothetical protein [Streptomyces griseosporeus]|uniref:hypothetical protein n=1 Tax=Streptomyces griseosporeus TaxID=1910 RepID=UPI00167ED68D|nr:hypothetical protein [Streptomyces griseosporeus]GHF92116.1 hypothetical protein GCM10018783_73690 [Streptomyces griseosporeus]
MDLTDDGHIYFPTNDGNWISEKQRRINEILQDYDPNLQLQWIPPGRRNEKDEPFRVVHFPPNGRPYLVCTAMEADERLLASVFASDQKKHGEGLLNWLDNYNRAKEIYNAKINQERLQEAHEMAQAVIRNEKSSYKIYDHRGELIDLERPGRGQSRTTYIW